MSRHLFGRPRTNNSLVNFQFRFVVCVICVVRCYECGEFGHLSFQCPSNILGDRTVPEKKKKKKSKEAVEGSSTTSVVSRDHASDEEEELEDDWSLGDAIRCMESGLRALSYNIIGMLSFIVHG